MIIFVGSDNPVKINAVKQAAQSHHAKVNIRGLKVSSGVKEQPMSDEETRLGAQNRARQALKLGLNQLTNRQAKSSSSQTILAVGLEGGVVKLAKKELWTTVWVCVIDAHIDGRLFEASGARFKLDKIIAQPILAGGEMGPIFAKMFHDDIRRKQGGIGIVTKNFVTRTEEYSAIVKMALGLWYGRNWQDALGKNNA